MAQTRIPTPQFEPAGTETGCDGVLRPAVVKPKLYEATVVWRVIAPLPSRTNRKISLAYQPLISVGVSVTVVPATGGGPAGVATAEKAWLAPPQQSHWISFAPGSRETAKTSRHLPEKAATRRLPSL
nr:hypothetical protein [Methylorubrum extorquens]